jgi:hypothetical protein
MKNITFVLRIKCVSSRKVEAENVKDCWVAQVQIIWCWLKQEVEK